MVLGRGRWAVSQKSKLICPLGTAFLSIIFQDHPLPFTMCGWVSPYPRHWIYDWLACATDETKLWFSLSAKQWVLKSWLVLGLRLCTRVWVHAMISMLKKPLSICQSGWKEILKRICGQPKGAQDRDVGTALQTSLTEKKRKLGLDYVCDTGYHWSVLHVHVTLW